MEDLKIPDKKVIDHKNTSNDENCLPACQSYEFNQDSIHVRYK